MPHTICTTATVEFAAGPPTVWAYVSELHRYAEWVHGTLEVLDADPVAQPGATYTERNRVLGPITARSSWTVAEVDPARGYQHHESGGMPGVPRMAVLMWVEAVPAGTRVTLTLEGDIDAGPLTGAIARLLHPSLRRSNEISLRALARQATQEICPA